MKKIYVSLAMITLTIAGVTAATVAYFSDTATVSANTFSAGTMNLKIDSDPVGSQYAWTDGFSSNQKFENLKPGSTGNQILDIINVGGVDGFATIQLNATAWSALGDNLVFTVSFDTANNGTFVPVVSGTLAQFAGQTYTLGNITGVSGLHGDQTGRMSSVKIEWSVPTSAGNDIQGKSVTIDAVFGLEQTP